MLGGIIKSKSWYESVEKRAFETRNRKIEIVGNLAERFEQGNIPAEWLNLDVISERDSRTSNLVESWDNSPIVLLGDSHTLVFHVGGDLHSEGSGFSDYLSREIGFPVDLVGVRGSGSTSSRVNLYRKGKKDPNYLREKKLVIWCLSSTEFTESSQGWKIVPLE